MRLRASVLTSEYIYYADSKKGGFGDSDKGIFQKKILNRAILSTSFSNQPEDSNPDTHSLSVRWMTPYMLPLEVMAYADFSKHAFLGGPILG